MYDYGEGVIEDKVQAYAWYKIAKANGNKGGEGVILRTYEQLAEAKKLVGEMIMASPNLLDGCFTALGSE